MALPELPWAADTPESIQRVATRLLEQLHDEGVRVRVSADARISYGADSTMMCSGYFIDVPHPELGMALGKPWQEWAPILLHECSHGAQWRENSPLWQNLTDNGRDIVGDFDAWIEGQDIDPARLQLVVNTIQAAEFDCERRVVELIEDHALPLDIPTYIQKANAYVWYYDYALRERQWYPHQGAPYENQAIWGKAPATWVTLLPADLMTAYHDAYATPTRRPSFRP